ncbi:hypothetical protein [Deinococcus yavapaiensis]|uniref:Uncharacterized protein n=1 Tax=Deinococcus yavapaiensis KR-236 TaxID=694435 RepID=A0A318S690_9DEIO|nr:hypothetical protein [Deinococcus yavapaiensis]PYE53142.1 hypothetical protein DES52_110126 [Deinococcus yavapaiensis KR-236]
MKLALHPASILTLTEFEQSAIPTFIARVNLPTDRAVSRFAVTFRVWRRTKGPGRPYVLIDRGEAEFDTVAEVVAHAHAVLDDHEAAGHEAQYALTFFVNTSDEQRRVFAHLVTRRGGPVRAASLICPRELLVRNDDACSRQDVSCGA